MENNKIVYITKEDCEKRGLIKLESGGYYKRNTIEKYAINGYLDNTKYDVITLLSTAYAFYQDYYEGGINKLSAIDPSKIMVDGSGNPLVSKKVTDAIDRYNNAIRILPRKMLSIVEKVCCEDKEIIATGTPTEKEYQKHIYLRMLTLGLCLLTKHYKSVGRNLDKCLFYI